MCEQLQALTPSFPVVAATIFSQWNRGKQLELLLEEVKAALRVQWTLS